MWQATKHGLYRQFNFADFDEAWDFMERVAALAKEHNHHPRWENEWSVVQIWLISHDSGQKITDLDRRLAEDIDRLISGTEKNEENTIIAPEASAQKESENESKPVSYNEITLYADGGSRGNPGHSASGIVLFDKDDKKIIDKGIYLGITTNNQAEYQALKFGLEEALKLQAKEVKVYMDSLLVINQMKGIFKVKNRDLWPIHDSVKELVKKFHHVAFHQIPREMNKAADTAVNRALDEHARMAKHS